MAIIGFVLILVNAIGYILKTNSTPSVIFILGIIFLVIGMMSIRKSER